MSKSFEFFVGLTLVCLTVTRNEKNIKYAFFIEAQRKRRNEKDEENTYILIFLTFSPSLSLLLSLIYFSAPNNHNTKYMVI